MEERKKRKRGKAVSTGSGKVRHVLNLSRESTDLLTKVREKYPRITSKGDEVDAAVKWWAEFALHFGLDANYRPMCPDLTESTPPPALSPRKAS